MLVDERGNDKYVANDTVIDDPSAQSKDHATSMSQGAGCGRRADYSDGHSLGGGFGILCDVEGDDVVDAEAAACADKFRQEGVAPVVTVASGGLTVTAGNGITVRLPVAEAAQCVTPSITVTV